MNTPINSNGTAPSHLHLVAGPGSSPTSFGGSLAAPPRAGTAHIVLTGGVDPYSPIEKRSLFAADAMRSKAFTVRLEDAAQASGWREVGVVSSDYLLVPNREVVSMAADVVAASGLPFEEARVHFDGKRFAYALAATTRPLVDVEVGDPVGLGLLFENSYDGSKKLAASLFAYRLACKNGMLVPSLFRRVTFKHQRANAGWDDDMARALAMLAGAPAGLERFATAGRALASMRVSAGRLREIRERVVPKLPVTVWGRVVDRFLLHESLDGWGLMNAATNVLWHDERATAATLSWNEYVATGLAEYALGQPRSN
ncbi:MAG TPA: DUF932 domain-containing protein [Rubricoccaceae bacterium]|jgi:hypothetical protein